MKPSTKRTLKKLFLNITAALFAVVLTGNVIAGENAGQINQFLGTKTSKTISTLPKGQEEGYSRYFDSKYATIAELKAAGEAKVREVEGEGIVLLKNENGTLPLAAGSKVSLVGVTVMDPVYGGTGSGAVDAAGAPNYYDVMTGAGFDSATPTKSVKCDGRRSARTTTTPSARARTRSMWSAASAVKAMT